MNRMDEPAVVFWRDASGRLARAKGWIKENCYPHDPSRKVAPLKVLAIGNSFAESLLREMPAVAADAVQLYREQLPVDYGRILSADEIGNLKKGDAIDFCGDVTRLAYEPAIGGFGAKAELMRRCAAVAVASAGGTAGSK